MNTNDIIRLEQIVSVTDIPWLSLGNLIFYCENFFTLGLSYSMTMFLKLLNVLTDKIINFVNHPLPPSIYPLFIFWTESNIFLRKGFVIY